MEEEDKILNNEYLMGRLNAIVDRINKLANITKGITKVLTLFTIIIFLILFTLVLGAVACLL